MARLYRLLFAAALLGIGAAAYADTFSFQFTEGTSGVIGSGTITAVPDASIPGAFDATNISGTYGAVSISGPLPCASYSPSSPCSGGLSFLYDDLIYPSGVPPADVTAVDDDGLAFMLGSEAVDIFATGTHTENLQYNGEPGDATAISATLTVAPTPEPSSVALLGSGVLGIALSFRRRLKGGGATKDN